MGLTGEKQSLLGKTPNNTLPAIISLLVKGDVDYPLTETSCRSKFSLANCQSREDY